ncbi:MAG: hypothetical protein K8E66_03435 [Phycisphaerales bacterium]|nr:hypothetical protein [Phycisphaerales bacterium]
MTRFLAILLLALPGIAGLGGGPASGRTNGHSCGHSGCQDVVVKVSCCGEVIEEQFCPSSGGPCQCSAAPIPDREPRPDAPLPRSDRESLTAVTAAPGGVVSMAEPELESSGDSFLSFGLLSGLSHNEIQSLLGVWRT